jgi:hypothetical protein
VHAFGFLQGSRSGLRDLSAEDEKRNQRLLDSSRLLPPDSLQVLQEERQNNSNEKTEEAG